NALNRQLENVPIAVVDEAGNSLAVECRRAVLALESGRNLVVAAFPADREQALADLRTGRYRAVWVLPHGLSAAGPAPAFIGDNTDRFSRSEEHTSELQSRFDLVCRLLLEKKKTNNKQ